MFTKMENLVDLWGDRMLVLARILLTILFLHEATTLLFSFGPASAAMARQGVPPVVLGATIALQMVAGLMIVLGWHGRIGAVALGVFCLMTAFGFHINFQSENELLHFEKDLAIAGGLFAMAIHGTGAFSLDRVT